MGRNVKIPFNCPRARARKPSGKRRLVIGNVPGAFWGILFAVVSLGGCAVPHKNTSADTAAEMQDEIAALRAAYAGFNRGDIEAAVQPLAPQIEWSEPAEFAGGGVYPGRDAAKRYLAQSKAGLAEGTSEPEQFIVAGNRIVVFVHAHVRPKNSGDWLDLRLADVYTFRDGKAIEMRAFADRQEALRWVGIEHPN